jgi:cysteine desulfurase
VGALYIREGITLPPLLHGGEQMGGLRGGTHDMQGIAALGMAALLADRGLQDEETRVRGLRDRFEETLLREIPDTGVNGARGRRTPNTSNIYFFGVEGEAVLWDLNENGIAASTGSACATGDEKASYVLTALGVPPEIAHSSIRFSLSRYNTDAEIDRAIDVVKKTVKRLRTISTTYKGKAV